MLGAAGTRITASIRAGGAAWCCTGRGGGVLGPACALLGTGRGQAPMRAGSGTAAVAGDDISIFRASRCGFGALESKHKECITQLKP